MLKCLIVETTYATATATATAADTATATAAATTAATAIATAIATAADTKFEGPYQLLLSSTFIFQAAPSFSLGSKSMYHNLTHTHTDTHTHTQTHTHTHTHYLGPGLEIIHIFHTKSPVSEIHYIKAA